jgi:hypothetical protein
VQLPKNECTRWITKVARNIFCDYDHTDTYWMRRCYTVSKICSDCSSSPCSDTNSYVIMRNALELIFNVQP